tara:strand:- start:131 stop:385 length:255 start_codon:yes stop_codon:yes gene_type:complete
MTQEYTQDIHTGQISANVTILWSEIDASFSHEFGTRQETEIDVKGFEVNAFARWDETFNTVIGLTPTEKEIETLQHLALSISDI